MDLVFLFISRQGYEELLRMGVWDFLINLSGADLPLRDIDDVSAMLASYRSTEIQNNLNNVLIPLLKSSFCFV